MGNSVLLAASLPEIILQRGGLSRAIILDYLKNIPSNDRLGFRVTPNFPHEEIPPNLLQSDFIINKNGEFVTYHDYLNDHEPENKQVHTYLSVNNSTQTVIPTTLPEMQYTESQLTNDQLQILIEKQEAASTFDLGKKIKPQISKAMAMLSASYEETSDNRIVMALPWKQGYPENLPKNYRSTKIKQQAMRNSVKDIPAAQAAYQDFVSTYLDKGFIAPLPKGMEENAFYITYFFVKKDSPTTPYRLVINCAENCAPKGQPRFSINDCLYTGDNLLSSINIILIEFRRKKWVATIDISKMFHRVLIRFLDSIYLCIHLHNGPHYFTCVPFGLTCAPTMACYAILEIVKRHGSEELQKAIEGKCYMDDITIVCDDEETLAKLFWELNNLLEKYGFPTGKIVTNSPDLLAQIPTEKLGESMKQLHDPKDNILPKLTSQLGVRWCTKTDNLSWVADIEMPEKVTKRAVTSIQAKINYDPTGIISPLTLAIKLIVQSINSAQRWLSSTRKLHAMRNKMIKEEIRAKLGKASHQDFIAYKKEKITCQDCRDKKHTVIECPEFLQADQFGRFNLIYLTDTCELCLYPGHSFHDCKSGKKCDRCKSTSHNTHLHDDIIGWDSDLRKIQDERIRTIIRQLENEIPNLQDIKTLKVPRLLPTVSNGDKLSLMVFSDGSQLAYAALVYYRVEKPDGSATMDLIATKCKLGPISGTHTQNMELLGAHQAAELGSTLSRELKIPEVDYFSDNKAIVHWSRVRARPAQSDQYRKFWQIEEMTQGKIWHYIEGAENPADIPTRGCTTKELQDNELYFHGPKFATQPRECWPKYVIECVDYSIVEEDNMTQDIDDVQTHTAVVAEQSGLFINPTTFLIEPCSTMSPITPHTDPVTAILSMQKEFDHMNIDLSKTNWVMLMEASFKNSKEPQECIPLEPLSDRTNLVGRRTTKMVTTNAERQKLIIKWIAKAQYEAIGKEDIANFIKDGKFQQKHLIKLQLFLDNDSLFRCKTRITDYKVDQNFKYPLLLLRHPIFELLARAEHQSQHTKGIAFTNQLTSRFEGKGLRYYVQTIAKACPTCQAIYDNPKFQTQGHLRHEEELLKSIQPFHTVNADVAGPYQINSGKRSTRTNPDGDKTKVYILVIICVTTKAVILESLSGLDQTAVELAFTRANNRYGKFHRIFTDNAKSFIATAKAIVDWQKVAQNEHLAHADWDLETWSFSSPYDHQGNGLAENTVRIVKRALMKMTGHYNFLLPDWQTVLTVVQRNVNSRPLVKCGDDSTTKYITPFHMLGFACGLSDAPLIPWHWPGEEHYDEICKFISAYKKQYVNNYLAEARTKIQWIHAQDNLKENQLVISPEDLTKRDKWPLGKIIRPIVDKDGFVRQVEVQLENRQTPVIRATRNLVPLNCYDTKNSF